MFVQKQFEADPFNFCAGLAGRDTACTEGAADFGCLVGDGGEVMTGENRGLSPIVQLLFAIIHHAQRNNACLNSRHVTLKRSNGS